MGVPEFSSFTFPEEDKSWEMEWNALIHSIQGKKSPISHLEDAQRALEIVYDAYIN